MASQSQRTEDLTLSEKMKIVQYLSILPAITIMVFMRRKVGFRMLKPSRLIGMAFFLWIIGDIFSMLPFTKPPGFIYDRFPLLLLAVGFLERYRRWKELCNGERWINVTSTNVGQSATNDIQNQGGNQSSGVTRSEQRRYFVEPARFTTLKRGGQAHNFQVQSIVYNGGHLFPTGAAGKEEMLPYKLITFNQR